MTFPTPAQRGDWFSTNYERPANGGSGMKTKCRCHPADDDSGHCLPTPDELGEWLSSNHELEGHIPACRMLAAGQYVPACRTDSCIDNDPGLLMHATWFDALDDARTILTHRIHGGSQ